MNTEQAIKFLQAHIELIEEDSKNEPLLARSIEVDRLAIAALRAQQERENPKPCDWCNRTLELYTNSGKYIPEYQPPRNYCPACGRKLEPKEVCRDE